MLAPASADAAPLKRAGVKAGPAALAGLKLTVPVKVKRRTRIKLTLVNGKVTAPFARRKLKKGRYTLKRKLLAGQLKPGLKVRIVARNLVTGRGGRGTLPVLVPILPVNVAPTDITLGTAAVPENAPAGQAVGPLTVVDPNVGDTHALTVVSGPFAVDAGVLETTAPLDTEATPNVTVRVRASDAGGLATEKQFTITVTNVNEAPTDLTLSASTVPENAPAGTLVGMLAATDPDFFDIPAFSLASGTGSDDNALFAVDGAMLKTAAAIASAPATRSVRLKVTDAGGLTFERQFTITITAVDDPPVLTVAAGAAAFTENGAPVPIDATLTVADPDSTQLTGAVVRVATATAADELIFANQNGIAGALSAGVLTLSGTASLADYQAALRSVTYRSTSDDPPAARTVEFTASDGSATSTAVSRSVSITAVPDAPTVTTTAAPLAYAENAGAVAIDPGLAISDLDSPQLQGATVQITGGFASGQDELAFSNQAGITGGYAAATGILTLTGAATVANYQTALRTVTYRNASDAPSPPARTVSFAVTDAQSTTSGPAQRGITITAVNDAPVVTTSAGATTYPQAATARIVDAALTVADGDDANLEGAVVRISAGLVSGDTLAFVNQLGITGAYVPATGVLTLTGTASLADYRTALRSVRFSSSAAVGARTVAFRGNDGDVAGPETTKTVNVIAVVDPPVVTTSLGTTPYTEGAAAALIDTALTVSDPNDLNLAGGVVTITAGRQTGDELTFTNQLGITGVYDAPTGVLSLSGTASLANYETALRSVGFRTTNDAPTASRTVSFAVNDGNFDSNSATKQVTITAVDDPPTAVGDAATVLEDALATAVPVLTNDTDPDAGPKTIASATQPANGTVVLTGGVPGAFTGLTYQPSANYCNTPPGTVLSTFTYTLNGGSTATVSMTVTCGNDAPVADDEVFNGNDSAIGNTTMVVNDPTDAAPNPNRPKTTIAGDILAGDTDADGPGPLTVTPGPLVTNDGGSVLMEADGDFTYEPAASTSCTDTSDFFDYTVEDSGSPEQTDVGRVTIAIAGCVWYVSNNAAGNSGTSAAPFDTISQAETASGNNHTVFVFDGDNTATGLSTGYALNAGERLIGEHEGLTVDPDGGGVLTVDTLFAANPGARPTLAATNEDVVDLDDGNEVRGFVLEPSGTGGGIAGVLGDTGGGTIDDVDVTDTGTFGTQPGVELDATTGTFNFSNLNVTTSGAIGIRLNNAGTVDVDAPVVTTSGAKALDASGTNLATSALDAVTVTGSATGGVRLSNTTGATTLGDGTGTDLALTTTSGVDPALALSNAGVVTVAAAGNDDLSATGGPAVDIVNTAGATLAFDSVSSTNSAGDGINLDGLGSAAFTATGGAIGGATGIAFDLNGGSGDVTYPGALNNGTGATAEISGRSGGAVTLNGNVADSIDAGGGILVSGNAAGSTTFGGTAKTINTTTNGTAPQNVAIDVETSPGHAVTFSGGGLDIDTGAGNGLDLDGAGAVTVSGAGNSLTTASGAPLDVNSGNGVIAVNAPLTTATGRAAEVGNRTGGSVTVSAPVTDTGTSTGINLFQNTGSVTFTAASSELDTGSTAAVTASNAGTVAFTGGGLDLATTSGTALTASGGGSLAVTGTGNRLTSTAGTALNVSGTTIATGGLVFQEIDADNPTGSGIVLTNTGNTAGLVVAGNGAACTTAATCTGGAIQNADQAGISLSNVGGGVSLTRMHVGNGLSDGIAGTTVTGLVLDNARVVSNGDQVDEHGLDFTDLTGTVTLTAPTITGNAENNVFVTNDAGTVNATVTGGRIASNSQTIGNDGILAVGTGTGAMTVNVQGTAFEDNRGDHVQMSTDASTTVVQNLIVNNTTMNTTAAADPNVLGGGITFNPGGNAVTDVTLTNNNIQQAFSTAITIDTPGSNVDPQPATIDATITGNTIGAAAVVDSGSESGDGIFVSSNGLADVDAVVDNNSIRQYANLAGIEVVQNDGNGTLDVTARNNSIANPGTFASHGIFVRSGLTGGTETGQTCVDLGHPTTAALKNSVTGAGAGGSADIRVRHLSNTTVRLPGYAGTAFDTAAVVTYLQNRNNPTTTPTVTSTTSGTGTGYITAAGCTLP